MAKEDKKSRQLGKEQGDCNRGLYITSDYALFHGMVGVGRDLGII